MLKPSKEVQRTIWETTDSKQGIFAVFSHVEEGGNK